MCQISVVLQKDGQQEKIMDNVAKLQVIEDGFEINALFEEPKVLPNMALKEIDFIDGVVVLEPCA